MAIGTATWDASGKQILSEVGRFPRLKLVTVSAPGSLSDPIFATGTPFAIILGTEDTGLLATSLDVTVSGTTMSWADRYGRYSAGFPGASYLLYGAY